MEEERPRSDVANVSLPMALVLARKKKCDYFFCGNVSLFFLLFPSLKINLFLELKLYGCCNSQIVKNSISVVNRCKALFSSESHRPDGLMHEGVSGRASEKEAAGSGCWVGPVQISYLRQFPHSTCQDTFLASYYPASVGHLQAAGRPSLFLLPLLHH